MSTAAVDRRATNDQYVQRFPVGSIAEPHARLQQRRRYDDQSCPGSMIVVSHDYPVWELECDACGHVAGLPYSGLPFVLRDQQLKSVAA